MRNKPPVGIGCLWYQVGDGWEQWAAGNSEGWLHEVRTVLAVDPTRLLQIHTAQECGDFQKRYTARHLPQMQVLGSYLLGRSINWPAVMAEYDGLELTGFTYDWGIGWGAGTHGTGSEWCYGWDCASGVVWNAADSVRVLRHEDRATTPAPSQDATIAEHDLPNKHTTRISLL